MSDLDDDELRATRIVNGVAWKEDIKILERKINKDYKDMMSVINSTSLPLFVEDTIEDMHILIENLIARNKELESALANSVSKDEIKEVIQRIDYDIKKTREVKLERYSDYDRVRLKAYITKSNEMKRRLQDILNKGE